VKAGTPETLDDYEKRDVEGITFYVRNDMVNKNYEIKWAGLWILGELVANEIE